MSTDHDAEVTALDQLTAALEPLDEPARNRAVMWLFDRYHTKADEGVGVPGDFDIDELPCVGDVIRARGRRLVVSHAEVHAAGDDHLHWRVIACANTEAPPVRLVEVTADDG